MAYIYFAKRISDEHYPYAKEIAYALYKQYGLQSQTGKPLTNFIRVWCSSFEKECLFYQTKHGLCRVYANYRESIQALLDMVKSKKTDIKTPNGTYHVCFGEGTTEKGVKNHE